MTTAQLILVSVTSALVAVFAMLLVATIKRARSRESPALMKEEEAEPSDGGDAGGERPLSS
jgi:hypothetical protein